MFLVILLVGTVSALGFEFIDKTYDAGEDQITIRNWFGLGAKQADYTLIENTHQCITDCFAEGNATLYTDAVLFSGTEFRNRVGDTKEVQRSEWILILQR